jgi:1,4-alpha-glucan branching enzyme
LINITKMRHYKTLNLLILLCTGMLSTHSQIVYTEPALPTADASVIVYFNSTGTPFEDYNGSIYTHTGITVNGNQWQHVIGSWGNNTNQPQLTAVSANLYKLEMNPTIRAFYGATANENITEMCFVFRSADGGTQTSPDIFIEVYEVGLNVSITFPDINPYFVDPGASIEVKVESTQAQSMSLYVDNNLIATVTGNSLLESIQASSEIDSRHWIKAIATDGTSQVTDSIYYYVRGDTEIADLPMGVRDGINYIDDQTVTLVLRAPYKNSIFVFGDFSNWLIGPEFKLKRNFLDQQNFGTRYWITISGLTPGTEYGFQYLIDEELVIADPYTDKVLDPWNDQWIDDVTYPNLKPYPSGLTTNIVSVLQTGQSDYNWQNTTFNPPAVEKLVIYELLLRDFIDAHDFQTLKDTISYFKRLGINAIEVMPFSEFEGNSNWGYNPSFYFAPDKYYGPKDALKAFVDECHSKGIAVIMDLVLNHAAGQNVMVRMYWDAENGRPAANNPWFNAICPHQPWCWGNDFNHESLATQEFVDRVTSYWLTEYKIDGFRFDYSKGFTNLNTQGSYDSERIALIKRMADEIWTIDPNAYIILEHWCDNSEEKELANYGCMLWGNFNYNYNEATMGYNDNSNFSWMSYKLRGWNDPHLVGFMESHDEERLMYKNIEYGNSSGNYDITDTATALRRMELAGAFYFTIPGPKMIWKFGELGYDYAKFYDIETGNVFPGNDEIKMAPKPIRWDYQNDYRRKRIFDVYGSLIKLKQEQEAFSTDDFTLAVGGAMKKIQLDHSTMNVTILGNFDVQSGILNPTFQHTGKWYNYFAGDSIDVVNVSDVISLEPGEYRIYTDVKLSKPEIGLGTGEKIESGNLNTLVYPNPSSGEFFFSFELRENSNVEVNIIDLNGCLIDNVFSGQLDKGTQTFKWNGADQSGRILNRGMYFVEFVADRNRETAKLIIR